MKQRWFSGPEARFALNLQKTLLQHSLAAWPRRGMTLLDINCGAGLFLPMLWESGFDVTGCEHSPALRARAVQNAPTGIEIQAAAEDHLPFADKSYDWSVLHLDVPGRQTTLKVESAIQEALRVTARGLSITFWNSASLPALLQKLILRSIPWPAPALPWWRIWRLMGSSGHYRSTVLSTLIGPPGSWNRQCPISRCNSCLRTLPLGAWCVLRFDMSPLRGSRGLPLRLKRETLRSPAPVMEYGSDSLSKKNQ